MLRILTNARQQQFAGQRLSQPEYQAFLTPCTEIMPTIRIAHGALWQAQTGYLKTGLLLSVLRDFFIARSSYHRVQFDYQELVLHPKLSWREFSPRHIVFCEGHLAQANPWFGGLPFQPAKGEILSCRGPIKCPEQIINFGHWLIPLDEQRFKLGATFEPGQTDTRPTEAARQSLLQGVCEIMPDIQPIEVLAQQVGVRPTTVDKQPFIGAHPRHANLHIFNGFGAKGSLAIPWHSKQFVAALRRQVSIPTLANVRRYYETHFPA
jgi:glycine/D-amino acid oxidase-like deaminating enzyme